MLGFLVALAMAASGGATPDDKTIHSCPNGWEVGVNPETGEKGCFSPDGYTWVSPAGYTWTYDGSTWSADDYPDPYGTEGYTW